MKVSSTSMMLLLALCPTMAFTQTTPIGIVNVTGGSAVSGYYRFDWSVGEMALIESYVQSSFTLENGLLHAGAERPISTDPVDFFAKGDIMLFPNPAYSFTEVNLNVPLPGRVEIRLMDILGKHVEVRRFDYNGTGRIVKFDVQRYPAGTYMLHVLMTPLDKSMPLRKGAYKLIHVTH